MIQFSGYSLKIRLYLVVLAAFIPVTILILYVAEEQKEIETKAMLQKTRLLAEVSADEENLQVESARSLLSAVAMAFRLVDGQPDQLSALLADMMKNAEGFAAFGVVSPEGRLIAGSNPSRMPQDYGDRPWFSSSRQRKGLAMGPYQGDLIKGEPVLYFAQPVFDAGGTSSGVVFAALDLNWMNRNIFKQLAQLPKGSQLTLLDEANGMLRYDAATGLWSVPEYLDPAVRYAAVGGSSGTLVGADENGKTYIFAFSQLKSAFRQRRISVVLGLPQDLAMETSRRIYVRNLVLLAVSALIALLAIWWATNFFILRRVDAMVRATRRLAAGDLRARIGPIGVHDELSHLAAVFDEMAASLQTRIEREEQVLASLKRSREQLRRLSAYQNDVREQERIRIAREIHDQLGQSLTILKMDLAWIKKHMSSTNDETADKMDVMTRVIEEAMERLHAVTAELRPVILDDFGLAAAVEWQAELFSRHSGIGCRLENNGYEPTLSKELATALFRIFQETLTNVMRHAEASEVVIRLEKHDGNLFFQVADNGKGITEEEINSPHAFGLLGIRERLYPFGGHAGFEGRPGQGTRVTIQLPLPPEGEKR